MDQQHSTTDAGSNGNAQSIQEKLYSQGTSSDIKKVTG